MAAESRPRLTFRRLTGLDRSGPKPPSTLRGQPLNPWTIPNAIGLVRLLGIPVFLVFAFRGDGTSAAGALVYALIAWGDYADGIAARVTGQYSRLGALLDPLVDRLLVVSGFAVCWAFELLPRWAVAALIVRELAMIVLVRQGLRAGLDLNINWYGRIGVWFVMSAPFWAMVDVHWLALLGLYVGLVLYLLATAEYLKDGLRQLRSRKGAPGGGAQKTEERTP